MSASIMISYGHLGATSSETRPNVASLPEIAKNGISAGSGTSNRRRLGIVALYNF